MEVVVRYLVDGLLVQPESLKPLYESLVGDYLRDADLRHQPAVPVSYVSRTIGFRGTHLTATFKPRGTTRQTRHLLIVCSKRRYLLRAKNTDGVFSQLNFGFGVLFHPTF